MKIRNIYGLLFLIFIIQSCSSDDASIPNEDQKTEDPTTEDPVEEIVNSAPDAFNLVSVENETVDTALFVDLKWEIALDENEDTIAYDIFLDTLEDPETKIASDITATEFSVAVALEKSTNYYWKVVAKDGNGGETSSASIFTFTTRGTAFASTALKESAEFSIRSMHTVTEFNDKLWLIGGADASSLFGDVWSSDDGENWTLVVDKPFDGLPKDGHTSLVYNDLLWVIGSFGDVWSSANGLDWTRATFNAEFESRSGYASVVFNNKMWVIGGRNRDGALNDVWSSTDGAVWTLETDNAAFPVGEDHTVTVFNDKLYLIGGTALNNFTPSYSNQVYTSEDGISWTQLTTPEIFEARAAHGTVVFENKLWVIGGWQVLTNQETGQQEITSYDDAWYSEDGATWKKAEVSDNYEGRFDLTTTVFNNKVFIIGGFKLGPNLNNREYLNDIWVIE